MDKTVRDHISDLEQRRNLLNEGFMEESTVDKRNRIETELRAVESALKFYRAALETERRLSQPISQVRSEVDRPQVKD